MVGGGSTDDGTSPRERGGELEPVQTLRLALDRYEETRSPQALDLAFSSAARAVAELRGERASAPPEVGEVRNLFEQVPEYEELVNLAVRETEHSVQAAGARLWDWFGLSTPPPRWNDGERARARLLVACACAPLDEQVVRWLGPRLLKLAADRWAGLLAAELRGADEHLWQRVLGERYQSVWRRCAPRSRWRTRELSDLLAQDSDVAASLERQLARWLRDGARMERLTDEVEAAFVHSRTPDRLA
jgi:hypothetical protein